MNKKGQYSFLGFGLVVILIVLLPLILFNTLFIQDTSNGHHTGQVTAVETTGVIFKTDRVFFKSDAQSSQEDVYCVIDKNVKSQLESYSRDKTTITVTYDDYLIKGWKYCDGESGIITGVTVK
jgi:hypothetical protein